MSATELEHAELRVAPLLPMEPEQAKAAMAGYQRLTAAMLTDDDWQRIARDKRFVKRSGWSKIATGYGLSVQLLSEKVDRDENGQIVRATVTVRASHPSGRFEDATGGCSIGEESFSSARSNTKRAKAEHDVPATAFTRARNRAIANLVGFGEVSAEELDGSEAPVPAAEQAPASPWGPVADEDQERSAVEAVMRIEPAISDFDASQFVLALGKYFKEGVPVASVKALVGLARFISDFKAAHGADVDEGAPPAPQRSAYHNAPGADL